MEILNPATDAVLRALPADDAAAVAAKHRRATAAQPGWAARGLAERQAALRHFRAAVLEAREPLAQTCTAEVGKPIAQSRREVDGLLGRIDYFVDTVPDVVAPETVLDDPAGGLVERITYEPLGVVANVSAWNYPFFVGANVFVPALLAGNAVLYKPSEYATLTGLAIAELLHAAGVPENVLVPVVGDGATGRELVAQPVDGVFFTGSHATGVQIAAATAPRLVKVQLELGGKDPVYVCDDVDVAAAAAAVADGAFYNTGQSCCAVERVYVHRSVWQPFVEAFVETVRGFVLGDPTEERTYIGALARRAPQLALLEAQVADALARGARLLAGGRRAPRPGWFFEPTVLVDVDHRMRLMREESFGPIIGLMPVVDDAEAARLMDDTTYGLTAGIYTRDRARAERVLAPLRTGSAYWNCCDRSSPRLPWSGCRHSGLGCTMSRAGIAAFVRPRAWHLRAP